MVIIMTVTIIARRIPIRRIGKLTTILKTGIKATRGGTTKRITTGIATNVSTPACWPLQRQAPVLALEPVFSTRGPAKMEKPVLLVIENEVLILMNIVHVAEDSGFDVLDAATAVEAIKVLESRSDVRAVITTVRMPGSMNGLRFARTVRDRWPSIQLFVTSGIDVSSHPDFPNNGRFIQKPYENEQIRAALREVLNVE
jgi:two-component system, response regulator PdtaR